MTPDKLDLDVMTREVHASDVGQGCVDARLALHNALNAAGLTSAPAHEHAQKLSETMRKVIGDQLEGLRLPELKILRLRFKDDPEQIAKIDAVIAKRAALTVTYLEPEAELKHLRRIRQLVLSYAAVTEKSGESRADDWALAQAEIDAREALFAEIRSGGQK